MKPLWRTQLYGKQTGGKTAGPLKGNMGQRPFVAVAAVAENIMYSTWQTVFTVRCFPQKLKSTFIIITITVL